MQDKGWATLLSFIPPERHDSLMLVTRSTTEIAIQSILRVDHQFVALKGRLAGSQDTGRLFFIPFSEIDYLGFQKSVREDEFHELFGGLQMPVPNQASAAPAESPMPVVVATAPTAEPAAPPVAPSAPVPSAVANALVEETIVEPGDARNVLPIRSLVLDRFRTRTGV